MTVLEGATMAHVNISQFWPLVGLLTIIPASRAFRLMAQFVGRR